jgi:hypothetical protein
MHTGRGQVVELVLEDGLRQARISCSADLVPSPGQYLLGGIFSSDPLPVSLFSTESSPRGFITGSPVPETWTPGTELALRGPLGRGFSLPPTAGKVAFVPFDDFSARLRGLIRPALAQGAAVVLLNNSDGEHLPHEVEVQPISTLDDILSWADFIAIDVFRESLPELRERLGGKNRSSFKGEAQVLIYAPVPCGGFAECGVCAVTLKSGWRLACKHGPVFGLGEI